jgi:hypothetical protein
MTMVRTHYGAMDINTCNSETVSTAVVVEAASRDDPTHIQQLMVDTAFEVLASLRRDVTLPLPLKTASSDGRD